MDDEQRMEAEKMVRRRWVRRLTDPDEPLTLEEFGMVPAALLLQEQAIGELMAPLEERSKKGQPMSALDLLILTLIHIRENGKDARLATEHIEGMVGSLDEFLASTNEVYQALASQRTKPAPGVLPEGRP